MDNKKTCEFCGNALPGTDAMDGLCHSCLISTGMENETAVDAEHESPPVFSIGQLQKLFSDFSDFKLIGRGGMGLVYSARQIQLDRKVAIKLVDSNHSQDASFVERFRREGRALAKLNHPNIVTIHDYGERDGCCYLVMEWVDGVNLRQRLHSGRPSAKEAMQVVQQICKALQYAHEQGLVHRDIKPENILINRQGQIKVTDFGIAKVMQVSPKDATLTETHMAMGTLNYMAPEQMERPLEVDQRADLYSLGVVFYEMLTGELPIGKFPPPSERLKVDARIDDIIFRSLEKQVGRRYQTAAEVATDMERIDPNEMEDRTVAKPIRGRGMEPSWKAWVLECTGYAILSPLIGLLIIWPTEIFEDAVRVICNKLHGYHQDSMQNIYIYVALVLVSTAMPIVGVCRMNRFYSKLRAQARLRGASCFGGPVLPCLCMLAPYLCLLTPMTLIQLLVHDRNSASAEEVIILTNLIITGSIIGIWMILQVMRQKKTKSDEAEAGT